MKTIDCKQGSAEWHTARLGKVTGSQFSNVLNKKTGRKTYMYRLAAERLTDTPQATYTNPSMEWGVEHEEEARVTYLEDMAADVSVPGFIYISDYVGVSPDGLVGEDGIIEIKCPNSTTHINTIIEDTVPSKYLPQIQGILWVTGRKWCDFISYDPRMKKKKFHCIRIERDEEYIENLKLETDKFIEELNELIKKVEDKEE